VETLGALGEEGATFFRDIGRRISVAAGDPRIAIHSVSVPTKVPTSEYRHPAWE